MTKKIPILVALLVVGVIGSFSGINYTVAEDAQTQIEKSTDPNQQIIAKIDELQRSIASDTNRLYSEKMLKEQSLYNLGPNWKILSVDYSGTEEPFELTHITVYATLMDDETNARQCEYGTEARIIYNAKTGQAIEKNMPKVDSECVEPITLGPQHQSANIPDIIQQALASSIRAYLTAEQGSSSGHYGGYVQMKAATFDEGGGDNIYNEMDKFVAFVYNQAINGQFFQVGWLTTTIDLDYLDADDKYFVYTDDYTHGELKPREATGITWSNDGDAIVYIQCGTSDDYFIYVNHNGDWFTHDTNYDCDNTTDNDSANNSVWLENANTVATSEWEDEITTDVKAWSAREFETKTTVTYWDSSSNTYENCPSGTGSTNDISGSLALGGTATWDASGIDDC